MLRAYDPTLDPDRPQFQLLLLRHFVCQLLLWEKASLPRTIYRWFLWRNPRRRLRRILYWQGAVPKVLPPPPARHIEREDRA
jgi:hypothetical protein